MFHLVFHHWFDLFFSLFSLCSEGGKQRFIYPAPMLPNGTRDMDHWTVKKVKGLQLKVQRKEKRRLRAKNLHTPLLPQSRNLFSCYCYSFQNKLSLSCTFALKTYIRYYLRVLVQRGEKQRLRTKNLVKLTKQQVMDKLKKGHPGERAAEGASPPT